MDQGIRKQTYSGQITEYIKACILKGEFTPGDKINEVDLAEQLGVSRAPIREALQHLAESGLLISVPQKGKFIANLTAKEIRDSYFTGGVLEGAAAASTIGQFTDDDFAAMKGFVNLMASCVQRADAMEAIAELDNAFHGYMFAYSDNSLLRALSRRSCQGISKFLLCNKWNKAFRPKEMHERHKRVYEAMITRDPVVIERVIREHYIESGERMAQYGSDVAKQAR
jgi:DNA-binding GntR family transcriptional regulator